MAWSAVEHYMEHTTRDQVLVISDCSPLSFDSRYFGPIPRAQIQSVVRPVGVW